jgi:hypothetical protein
LFSLGGEIHARAFQTLLLPIPVSWGCIYILK